MAAPVKSHSHHPSRQPSSRRRHTCRQLQRRGTLPCSSDGDGQSPYHSG